MPRQIIYYFIGVETEFIFGIREIGKKSFTFYAGNAGNTKRPRFFVEFKIYVLAMLNRALDFMVAESFLAAIFGKGHERVSY